MHTNTNERMGDLSPNNQIKLKNGAMISPLKLNNQLGGNANEVIDE